MKKNILFLFMLFTLTTLYCRAQNVLRLANDQFQLFNYYNAVNFYEQAYNKKPTLYTAVQLATCFNRLHNYKNEESWYATAITLATPPLQPALILSYAKALQNNSKYTEAKQQYEKYGALNNDTDKAHLNLLVASCDSAVKWMQNPHTVEIKNMVELNSKSSDFGAALYYKDLIFASDRGLEMPDHKPSTPFLKFDVSEKPDKKIYGWTGKGYLKLYSYGSVRKNLNTFIINAGYDYHMGPASFTADGCTVYFTITEIPKHLKQDEAGAKTIRIEIFSSKMDMKTHQWQPPVPFKFNNIQQWSVGDPFITPNGNCIYFVSDMPGGKGGTDIYYSLKGTDGNWTTAVNMTDVNTPGNERTPSVNFAGKFFYSTDGGITMGGLDIYKGIISNYHVTQIKNMGYPINSPQDDFSLVNYYDDSGYLSSDRDGGLGKDDIYSFKPKTDIKLLLEGYVYDKVTRVLLKDALVALITDSGSREQMGTDTSGYFHFRLKRDNTYRLTGEKTNYTADAASFTTMGISTSQTIRKDLYLDRIVINKPIVLKNINYDFDKANIRPDAKIELDKLVQIMKDNPTIWIELSSHTDSRGSDAYNLVLSQRRADSAVGYLVKTGRINPNRIQSRGYGETHLLNKCGNGVNCTETEHQTNRRTEFKITRQ